MGTEGRITVRTETMVESIMKPFELTEEEIRHIIGRRKAKELWSRFQTKRVPMEWYKTNKPLRSPYVELK